MCAQKISSIVWGWTLSTNFVYGTDCFCEVVCSGESPSAWGLLAMKKVRFTGSPECSQERPTKAQIPWGTSGVCLGLPQKAKLWLCFILFYLILFYFTFILISFYFSFILLYLTLFLFYFTYFILLYLTLFCLFYFTFILFYFTLPLFLFYFILF